MPYSYVVYTGNGSTTQFAITFPYIRKEHVKVYVNYVDTAYTYVNDTTVQLAAAPASPLRVEVRRVTPLANVLVDYTDGSTLVAADLDTSNLQSLYNEQELDDNQKRGIFVDDATGLITAGNQRITNVANPVNAQDAATKTYVDTADALKLAKAGGSMTGAIAMGTNKITGLGTPTVNTDAATKAYVDSVAVLQAYVDAADALKVAKAGDSMTGALAMGTNKITGLGTPTASTDATTKAYVDAVDTSKVAKAGDSMTGALAMGTNKITGLGTPTASTDATTKAYVDAVDTSKVAKAGDSMTGALAMGTNKITGLGTPTASTDATTKAYVDAVDTSKVAKAGDSMTGALAMGTNKITGLGTPTASTDATTKAYVDGVVVGASVTQAYVDAADALKVAKAGDSMTGALAMGTNKITGLGTPTVNTDAATKAYVDTADALKVAKAGDSMTGALAMGANKITGLGTPTVSTDAVTKAYVDAIVVGGALTDGDYGDITVSGTGTALTIDTGVVTSAKILDGTILNVDVNASAGIVASKLAFTQAGTGAVASTIDSKLKNVISVKDFGAVGDGSTNDFTAFTNAIAAATGKALYIPAGTYLITLPNATGLGTLENIKMYGDGLNSFLDIRTATSAFLSVFVLRSNTIVENLKIKLTLISAQTAFLFTVQTGVTTSGVTFRGCELFTNYAEGSFAQDSYLLNINNTATAVNDFLIDGCSIHNWLYIILKTNAATSNDSRWTVTNNRFYDNATSHLSINSPLGSHDGLVVSNNIFNTVTKNVAGVHHFIGLASVKNCVISSNMFKGLTSGDCIHIEENSDFVTVQGNVIEVGDVAGGTTWGDGIRILDNNISLTRYVPTNISIVGNTIFRTGTRGGNGIAFTWDSADTNAEFVTCANNVVDGFGVGILVDGVSDTIRINSNVVRNCNEGIYMPGSGNSQIASNSLISCVKGLFGQGLVGSHHFLTCTAEIESSLAAGTLSLAGWSMEKKSIALSNGNTAITLMRAGLQLQGLLKVTVKATGTKATFLLNVLYDGTTLTTTSVFLYQPSTIQFASMAISGGQLGLTIFCNGGNSGAVVRADFDGLYVSP